ARSEAIATRMSESRRERRSMPLRDSDTHELLGDSGDSDTQGFRHPAPRGFLKAWASESLDPGAAAFSPVRNINRKPSEGFSLAADDNGDVTACWLSDKLFANVSHDNGETFDPYIEINKQFNPCNCCTTSAAYGEDGRL